MPSYSANIQRSLLLLLVSAFTLAGCNAAVSETNLPIKYGRIQDLAFAPDSNQVVVSYYVEPGLESIAAQMDIIDLDTNEVLFSSAQITVFVQGDLQWLGDTGQVIYTHGFIDDRQIMVWDPQENTLSETEFDRNFFAANHAGTRLIGWYDGDHANSVAVITYPDLDTENIFILGAELQVVGAAWSAADDRVLVSTRKRLGPDHGSSLFYELDPDTGRQDLVLTLPPISLVYDIAWNSETNWLLLRTISQIEVWDLNKSCRIFAKEESFGTALSTPVWTGDLTFIAAKNGWFSGRLVAFAFQSPDPPCL